MPEDLFLGQVKALINEHPAKFTVFERELPLTTADPLGRIPYIYLFSKQGTPSNESNDLFWVKVTSEAWSFSFEKDPIRMRDAIIKFGLRKISEAPGSEKFQFTTAEFESQKSMNRLTGPDLRKAILRFTLAFCEYLPDEWIGIPDLIDAVDGDDNEIRRWVRELERSQLLIRSNDSIDYWCNRKHVKMDPYRINHEKRSEILIELEGSAGIADRTDSDIKGDTANDAYVHPDRIIELGSIKSEEYDLRKLVRLCEELNICFERKCYLASAMIVRAILDHVPPIFGYVAFKQVAANYAGASFKDSMARLENSLRNIADGHLHRPIRKSEVLPNRTQVYFGQDLDVLLAEVVRLLQKT